MGGDAVIPRPLASLALLFACTPSTEDAACGDAPCDAPQSRDDLLDAIDGFADPMASWLRTAADDHGGFAGGIEAALRGLGDAVGCGADTERSFVVLSNQALRPKAIVTRCVDDPVGASRFFVILEPDDAGTDLDADRFRVAAWDPDAAAYRRYQMLPRSIDDGLAIAVEPAFCTSCHGGPYADPRWTPIMNEMTNPWAQWNAEPGFVSFAFDPAALGDTSGPVYEAITAADRLDSAANLEPIVRAAIDRTSNARLAVRDDAADLDAALELLRPVFCDESVNFVSEIHDSGEINTNAIVDAGLRRAMLGLGSDLGGAWPWLSDPTVRIPAPGAADEPLVMLAVRGETTVQAEAALASRQVLDARSLLAVRALDWTHPVFSPMRCGLWQDAAARAEQGGLDPRAFADNAALVRALFDDAMRELVPGDPAKVIAIADAEAEPAASAIASGDLEAFELLPVQLGETIDQYVRAQSSDATARSRLHAERRRRGCIARSRFVTTPLVPGLEDCA